MRINIVAIILVLLVNVAADIYIARAIRSRTSRRWPLYLLYGVAGISLASFLTLAATPLTNISDATFCLFSWLLLLFVSLVAPRCLFVIIDLAARIPQLFRRRRCRAVSAAAIVIAALSFAMIWWGALVTRFSLQVKEVTVEIAGLPDSFEGYRIAQISDMHVGTYGEDTSFVEKLVERVNALHPDMIVFTGDIVNRHANEARPFISALTQLSAPDGQYAILGNHDYADYYYPDNSRARDNDRARLINFYSLTAFDLILDDYRTIYRGSDSIAVIGVENIGRPPFSAYGNLRAAYPALDDNVTKILLSHDPSHWHDSISGSRGVNIALTLSGHTHAMQTRLLGWSPASLVHDEWGGLYRDASGAHQLYINIGTGTVGAPMRIGATPEITLITLKKKS